MRVSRKLSTGRRMASRTPAGRRRAGPNRRRARHGAARTAPPLPGSPPGCAPGGSATPPGSGSAARAALAAPARNPSGGRAAARESPGSRARRERSALPSIRRVPRDSPRHAIMLTCQLTCQVLERCKALSGHPLRPPLWPFHWRRRRRSPIPTSGSRAGSRSSSRTTALTRFRSRGGSTTSTAPTPFGPTTSTATERSDRRRCGRSVRTRSTRSRVSTTTCTSGWGTRDAKATRWTDSPRGSRASASCSNSRCRSRRPPTRVTVPWSSACSTARTRWTSGSPSPTSFSPTARWSRIAGFGSRVAVASSPDTLVP